MSSGRGSSAAVPVAGSRVPLLVYRGVFTLPHDDAEIEAHLGANGWPAQWRDVVYAYVTIGSVAPLRVRCYCR